MNAQEFAKKLNELNASDDMLVFFKDKSLQEAWMTCYRGAWMTWLYVNAENCDLRKLVLCRAHQANTVQHLMPLDCKKAVDVAIAFGEGTATEEELANADRASAKAFRAVANGNHRTGTYSAARAASAATNLRIEKMSASECARYASDAAAGEGYRSADTCTSGFRIKNMQLTAEIARRFLPMPIFK